MSGQQEFHEMVAADWLYLNTKKNHWCFATKSFMLQRNDQASTSRGRFPGKKLRLLVVIICTVLITSAVPAKIVLFFIKQIHIFTSNIFFEQQRFGLGCPAFIMIKSNGSCWPKKKKHFFIDEDKKKNGNKIGAKVNMLEAKPLDENAER